MYENFDELFKAIIKKTRNMTMFQTDCFLHSIYKEYRYMIGLKGYDEDTFFSLVHFKDVKLADDNHVKRLMNDGEAILEKYNRGLLYGTKVDGVRYYNHFKRDNEGFWNFHYYEEKE